MSYYRKKRIQSGLVMSDVANYLGIDCKRYEMIDKGIVKMPKNLIDKFNELINKSKGERDLEHLNRNEIVNAWWEEMSTKENGRYKLYDLMEEYNIPSLSQLSRLLGYSTPTMICNYLSKKSNAGYDYKNKLYSFFENELNIQEPTTRKRKYATKQKMPMAIENIYKIDFEKYMFDNDLSTKQLAKEIGISQSTIGRILSKKLTGTTKKVYNSITSWLNNLPDSKCYLKDDTEEFVEEKNDKNDNYNCSLIDSCNYSLIEKYTNIVDDLSGQAVEIISKLNNLQKDLEKINDKKSIYEELLDDLKGVEVSVTRD